ncbi:suppressor protein spt23-like protein [Lasiosphaeria hispida]|uniref:Suppressor protein spt23-like protein n=1 Tax=Lasiosphaeria hispida TaxID=260671 RepID=A0AAJ0H927_9PEZI|nr:suppressor protein spt23-like protein [Lasiosphaeria hispida]
MLGQDGNLVPEEENFVNFGCDFETTLGTHFHPGEYMNSDESSPNLPSSPIPNGLSYATAETHQQGDASPSVAFTATVFETSPLSGNSSGDSLSDSSSFKRDKSRKSSKSTLSGGDGAMDDGSERKTEWMFNEFIDMRNVAPSASGLDIMPSIENPAPHHSNLSTMAGLDNHRRPFDARGGIHNQNLVHNHSNGVGSMPFAFTGADGPSVFDILASQASQGNTPDAPSPGSWSFNGLGLPHLAPANPDLCSWQQPNAVPPAQLSMANAPPHTMAPQYSPTYPSGQFRLGILPCPTKSRVETQIPIRMVLDPLPFGATKIHLPRHTISKPKLVDKAYAGRTHGTLELHTSLVCTSAIQSKEVRAAALERARIAALSEPLEQDQPVAQSDAVSAPPKKVLGENEPKAEDGGEVHICNGCKVRERKRAGRKKTKKVDEESAWVQDEHRRVVVFNTHQTKDWGTGPNSSAKQVDLPMRIACYCRHHGEKQGYTVIFTITDWNRQFIAQTTSPCIMITDDHKTHVTTFSPVNQTDPTFQPNTSVHSPSPNQNQDMRGLSPGMFCQDERQGQKLKRSMSDSVGAPETPAHQSISQMPTPQTHTKSPGASPSEFGYSNKKRKSNSAGKVPTNLAMTRLDTGQSGYHLSNSASMGASPSSITSPLAHSLSLYGHVAEQSLFNPDAGISPAGSFGHAPPPRPGTSDQKPLGNSNEVPSLDDLNVGMYSGQASTHQSRAPSPSPMPMLGVQHNNLPAQGTANSLPTIFKIIPGEGPKSGGIEVTILGSGFYSGIEVMFGDSPAPTTTYWGATSLVCLVPPARMAGIVNVTTKNQAGVSSGYQKFFKYVDDDEHQLLRTALTVLSNKMNGGYEDVTHIARRIIDGENVCFNGSGGEASGGTGFNNFTMNMSFESQLLKLLELVDLDDSPHKPKLNLRRSTGQSMLHLACSLGHHRLVAGLLARGVHVDLRDNGGYTALHMAALNSNPEIVRRLIAYGADPTIRTLSGLTPGDVAQSQEVLRALRRVERHVRSRSGGSLHSRASSTTSLKSLWEPMSRLATREPSINRLGSDEESLEYSSVPGSEGTEESSSEDEQWLDMRRGNTRDMTPPPGSPDHLQPPGVDAAGGVGSPTAAMTQFKEQVAAQLHQLQQTMTLHFQSLPQLRQFPQFPYPLPNYQAAVLQHLAAMMPKIGGGGPRPEMAGDQQPAADGKGWWDLSSLMAGPAPGSAPPPAYEEIFPQERGQAPEKKQASPLEVKADAVCEALFGHQQDAECSSSSSSRSATNDEDVVEEGVQSLPAVLQIGRKNAITKEQQENLRRVHAERLKPFSRDRNLFFIWIPLLIIAVCAWFYGYSWVPGSFSAKNVYAPLLNNVQQLQQRPLGPIYDQAPQGRVIGEV